MKKMAVCFTKHGADVIRKINTEAVKRGIEPADAYIAGSSSEDEEGFARVKGSLKEWASQGFKNGACLIFVSATGIAVRTVSELVSDKLSDSPVIVIDDNATFVIPVLSGHAGGADKIAQTLAGLLNAVPVITTSTDVNGAFSADVYACENNLKIANRDGIKKVSSKAIEGKTLTISVKDYPPEEPVDIIVADETDREYSLLLAPRKYTLGIGMKKNTDPYEAEEFIAGVLTDAGIGFDDIYAICTIDVKEEEPAIIYLRDKYRIPVISFDAALLNKARGDFNDSDFVRETVGVGNVCERAAVLGAGNTGELPVQKKTGHGITAAIAKRESYSGGADTSDNEKVDVGKGTIYVVGIGPGDVRLMTKEARAVLQDCDVIVGYKTYVDLIRDRFPGKEFWENGMRGESERCEKCIEFAKECRSVALICSGDAGVYGMASPMLETAAKAGFSEVRVMPGVTAACSGAALLGAPLNHDFCVISLSDLLTPWEKIEERLLCAARGDFCIAIYNPASHGRADYLKRACGILLTQLSPDTCCGYVRNIGREGTRKEVTTLEKLKDLPADMLTTVFVGNSQTYDFGDWMITPRGYGR